MILYFSIFKKKKLFVTVNACKVTIRPRSFFLMLIPKKTIKLKNGSVPDCNLTSIASRTSICETTAGKWLQLRQYNRIKKKLIFFNLII